MTHGFEKDYWERHWDDADPSAPANPHLVRETAGLAPGTALDAGCGAGAEAVWLASRGWSVTAADISSQALARASERAAEASVRVTWIEADLTSWEPEGSFDLVTTHYAHPAIPQLDFYRRIARWVGPRGTLLIVGHLQDDHGEAPSHASVTLGDVTGVVAGWRIETAEEVSRAVAGHGVLRDVVVRATRE